MTPSRRHSPFAGAVWMMVAGLCFAAVNSLSQYVSFKLGLPSTQVAFHQYLIALVCLLPWLIRHGLRQSLMTNQLRLHLLRVALAVVGIQFWLWALAVPVPIWQGIALRKSGNPAQAEQHFRHFIDWAAQHRDDVPQVDFFAVSLPDLVVLDVSAQQRHQQHCLFIEALGHLGLGNVSACQQRMQQLLQINPAHDKAHLIRHALQSGIFS